MTRRLISSGSEFEKKIGYSRAVVDGEWVFVSGTTGFDYAAGTISDDVAEQTRQTLRNIEAGLQQCRCLVRKCRPRQLYRRQRRRVAPSLSGSGRGLSQMSVRQRRRSSVVWLIRA